jgi:hypothetical protein
MGPSPLSSSLPLRWWVALDGDLSLTQRICRADGTAMGPPDLADLAPVAPRARDVASAPRLVDGCVALDVDLAAAARLFHDRSLAIRAGEDVVLASPDVWLWTRTRPMGGRLTFTSAPGTRAALPFPRVDDAHAPADTFEVDPSTWRLLSTGVFGDVEVRELTVAGAVIDLVTLPGERYMSATDVDRWVAAAADAVATGSGPRSRFPFDRVMVVVEPVRGDGVPFGMVTRGGGPHALLLLGGRARVEDVIDDWVAVHELSHLLHPLPALDEAWFGEGLATWHQVVLRARAGLITEEAAWAALRDGFERGAAAAERGPWTLSLREASARMRAEGRWVQTYWGGAAIAFVVDVGLRRCGGISIDDVVATLRAEQPRIDARRIPAADVVARAAAVAPGCHHLTADVEAMLAEPFPARARPLLDAILAVPPRDPTLAGLGSTLLQARPAGAAVGRAGRLSAP